MVRPARKWTAGACIWAGLAVALFACGGDDSTTSSDAGKRDASKEDASKGDASKKDDAAVKPDSAAQDAGPPAPLHLCDLFDSFWGNETRSAPDAWPSEILNGPPSTLSDGGASPDPDVGLIGFLNVGDCEVGTVYADGLEDATSWQNQLTPFTYRFFGCADNGVTAGKGFELVPPSLYGKPFGPDDLKKLGDWYVQSVIQAIANRSAINASAMLTTDQIDAIQAEMDYQESLYPSIIKQPGFHYSTCSDAGAGGGDD